MDNCLFCKIAKHEIEAAVIYEDEKTLAFLDINPTDNGHTLVIPKKHTRSFNESDDQTLAEVTKTKKKVADLLTKTLNPAGFTFVTNNGREAFQEIFHYHEHVIPKYQKSAGYFPGKNAFEKKELAEVYQNIKIKKET